MRRLFVLIAVLGLVAASCGGDSGGGSCEAVADEVIEIFQEVIDEFDELSIDELGELEEEPQSLVDMEKKFEDLESQATDLGCSDAEMEELFEARIGNLTSDGLFGQFMIEGLEESGFFE
ncbi:MAG: hypothetical protein GY788_30240 [bacterium]|nr:hypothetical protein [bacterium]